MIIPSLGIDLFLSSEERKFMHNFFRETSDFIETQDMLKSDNIKLYNDMYSEYLAASEYSDNESLKLFTLELKLSQIREKKIENKEIKLSLDEKMFRRNEQPSSVMTKCKNKVINKWRKEAQINRVVPYVESIKLNRKLEPILEQNQ